MRQFQLRRLDNDELWKQYKETDDPQLFEELCRRYMYVADRTAGRMLKRVPRGHTTDDIPSYARIGLMDAIKRFEPERGHRFETYAILRVRGEIVDSMRRVDWVPRRVRNTNRAILQKFYEYNDTHGYRDMSAQIMEDLNITREEYDQALQHMDSDKMVFIDMLKDPEDTQYQLPDSGNELDIETEYDVVDPLVAGINALPEKERVVFTLFYYSDLYFYQISELLGMSESKVTQLHTKAMEHLRAQLGD